MNQLKDIFYERDQEFNKKTTKIFEIIHDTLVCVTEFINDIKPITSDGVITWEDVSLVQDTITITGTTEYLPGTSLLINDEVVIITENTSKELQQVIYVSLPFSLVETKDYAAITNFLYQTYDDNNIIDQFPALLDILSGSVNAASNDQNSSIQDFDLSKLTKEQLEALELHNLKGKG